MSVTPWQVLRLAVYLSLVQQTRKAASRCVDELTVDGDSLKLDDTTSPPSAPTSLAPDGESNDSVQT